MLSVYTYVHLSFDIHSYIHTYIHVVLLRFSGDALKLLRKQSFSTKDTDNDNHDTNNCAKSLGGGWWYNKCGPSNLNGNYITDSNTDGIRWNNWKSTHSFKSTEMKIRRA